MEGRSGYSLKKLVSLWFNGVTSFSIKPLRFATYFGFFVAAFGFVFALVTIIRKLVNPAMQAGWASTISLILLMGGVIVLLIGLVGEYIGRIYLSINRYPQFVVRRSDARRGRKKSMKTTHAVWERENIGVDAWEIALDAQDTIEALRRRKNGASSPRARSTSCSKARSTAPSCFSGCRSWGIPMWKRSSMWMIRRKDYHMPDTIARFDRGLTAVERTDPDNQARIDRIIRSGIFISDRVSIDPAFVRETGRPALRQLAALHGGRSGGHLYEVLAGRKAHRLLRHLPQGRGSPWIPVLMAMYDQQNDRGLGALLHKKTLDTCFTHRRASG